MCLTKTINALVENSQQISIKIETLSCSVVDTDYYNEHGLN